jgi:hypothetical protein
LKDVISFTGVLTTAGQRVGQPVRQPTLKTVGDFVPSIPAAARRALGKLISALAGLPSFDLQAEIVGPATGLAPFAPEIVVHPASGAIIETVLNYFKDGVALPPGAPQVLVNGTDVSAGSIPAATFNQPGHYMAVITRTGITSEGIKKLVRQLPFTVSTPAPVIPPHRTPPSGHPTCSVELAPSDTISDNFTTMRIFGDGFVPGEGVEIIENGIVIAGPVAAMPPDGSYTIDHDFLHGLEPTEHVVTAHGVRSGRDSNSPGFTV